MLDVCHIVCVYNSFTKTYNPQTILRFQRHALSTSQPSRSGVTRKTRLHDVYHQTLNREMSFLHYQRCETLSCKSSHFNMKIMTNEQLSQKRSSFLHVRLLKYEDNPVINDQHAKHDTLSNNPKFLLFEPIICCD